MQDMQDLGFRIPMQAIKHQETEFKMQNAVIKGTAYKIHRHINKRENG